MRLALIGIAFALAGCAGESAVSGPPAGASRAGAPPEPLAGRWQLAADGGIPCVMNLTQAAGEGEGAVRPEGGCPGNFYTSRKWSFEGGSLVIRDHKGEPLGQLAHAGPGRFDGKTTSGQQVMLNR